MASAGPSLIRATGVVTAAVVMLLGLSGCDRADEPARARAGTPPASHGAGAGAEEGAGGGGEQTPAPVRQAWFEEIAATAGLDFVHTSGARERFLFPEIMGGGAALFDMDDDGDLDAYLVQSGTLYEDADAGALSPNRLYRNRGDGAFEDCTEGSGADDRGYGMGVATGDYDNDGDLDLYVTNVGPNTLLRNDGGGRFTDVTAAAAVGHAGWGTGTAFLDYDADGFLDLFVVNYLYWAPSSERDCFARGGERDYCSPKSYRAPAEDLLYHNNGDGTFTDMTEAAGLRAAFGNGLGIVCGDFNGDDRIDVFVANDGTNNQLWINRGDGTFVDEAMIAGCAMDEDGVAKAGMGVDAADIDDDQDLDLFVVNLRNEADSFYRNEGDYFVDATRGLGLSAITRPFTRFGMALIDFDQDGRRDLFEANGGVGRHGRSYSADPYAEPNVLLRGTPDGRFEEVTPRGGTSEPLAATSRAAVFGDVDGDGGVDVLVVNRDAPAYLLRNIAPSRGHWIMFRVLEKHGRDALGASITLRVGDRTPRGEVRTTYSYCAANDPRVHFGLGDATRVEKVVVRWPDGTEEAFGRFEVDRLVVLRRGGGAARAGGSSPNP